MKAFCVADKRDCVIIDLIGQTNFWRKLSPFLRQNGIIWEVSGSLSRLVREVSLASDEVLLLTRPAETSGQCQIVGQVVVHLSKCRDGRGFLCFIENLRNVSANIIVGQLGITEYWRERTGLTERES